MQAWSQVLHRPAFGVAGLDRVDGVLGLTETDDDGLLVHRHDVNGVGKYEEDSCGDDAADNESALHRYCPFGVWRPRNWSSGRIGTAPALLSMMI